MFSTQYSFKDIKYFKDFDKVESNLQSQNKIQNRH